MSYLPRIEANRILRCFELNVGIVRSFIEGVPDDAKITIHSTVGDRPGERAIYTMSVMSVEEKP